jgi:hypothetical protein
VRRSGGADLAFIKDFARDRVVWARRQKETGSWLKP